MASFDDDPAVGSQEEDEDDEMEDVNDMEQDAEPEAEEDANEEEDEDDNDDNDNENDDDDADGEDAASPSRRPSQNARRSSQEADTSDNPSLAVIAASPHGQNTRSVVNGVLVDYIPPPRPEAVTALAYDIVPTMAAPQSTSINAVTVTPDMRWVFSGGTDGYVRMYNWVDTANGKVPLTVAQKHPFVDSVMKAGSLVTYWENEETALRTPPSQTDEKWLSPVYSLAVQHQALWLLSGTESGAINLQTCRHQAGTRITTLREHTNAVSVLALSADETTLLSGSWDKTINDWDLQSGKVKRSFRGAGSQVSAVEPRPFSSIPVPEVTEPTYEHKIGTFSSNNSAAAPLTNGHSNMIGEGGDEDAVGSPSSLFGDGSLFGDDNDNHTNNANVFGDDDFTEQLTNGLSTTNNNNTNEDTGATDIEMSGIGDGGPVQSPKTDAVLVQDGPIESSADDPAVPGVSQSETEPEKPETEKAENENVTNGLPHTDEPLTAPPTNSDDQQTTVPDSPSQSESTFLDAAIDGSIRIWDRRIASPVATILPVGGTAPWCTGACWSPDGNFFYAGRRGCTVDEYSIHNLGSKKSEPNRVFKFQNGSGPVYAVRALPNKKHLICASNDILRLYDLAASEAPKHRTVPFTIVPGHRGGVISSIYIDPTCRFMLSAAGNRGWEGGGTEVLLGYEIGVQDPNGAWHK